MFHWIRHLAMASGTEGKFTSLGIMGPVLAMVLMLVNSWWGAELIPMGEAELVVNNVIAVVGMVVGIYGRIRATKTVEGDKLK